MSLSLQSFSQSRSEVFLDLILQACLLHDAYECLFGLFLLVHRLSLYVVCNDGLEVVGLRADLPQLLPYPRCSHRVVVAQVRA